MDLRAAPYLISFIYSKETTSCHGRNVYLFWLMKQKYAYQTVVLTCNCIPLWVLTFCFLSLDTKLPALKKACRLKIKLLYYEILKNRYINFSECWSFEKYQFFSTELCNVNSWHSFVAKTLLEENKIVCPSLTMQVHFHFKEDMPFMLQMSDSAYNSHVNTR